MFRKKRNISDYEQVDTISDFEADDVRHLAERLRGEVEDWLRKNHPEYGV
jgi:hypothetical protein